MVRKKKVTKKVEAEDIIAATETDGGVGELEQVEELELAKDVEVNE